jgi:hypothetical protein
MNTLPAIVICTTNARCLAVMQASIAAYVPREVEVLIFRNVGDSFGEAYNFGVRNAFITHSEVVVCNDDIVFTPTTWETLLTDVGNLRANIEISAGSRPGRTTREERRTSASDEAG